MKAIFVCVLAVALSGCALSMLPDSSGTKLHKSPCACVFEPINDRS